MAVREYTFTVGPETSELPSIGVPSDPDDLISQGYADLRYTQGSSAVADIASLKAMAEAERRDGDFVLVKDVNNVYRFDSASAATGDDNFVLTPDAGTGRWIRVTILNRANTFTDTTDSSSKDTGSMILEGGLGVEKSVYVGGSLNVTGDLTVSGTTTTIDTTTMEVEDPNVLLNKGGDQATANTSVSGVTVEMSDATNARLGYDSSLASKFKAGEVGSESEILTAAGDQTLSGKKTFDSTSGTDFLEVASPSSPNSGDGRLYFSSADKTFHQIDDTGADQSLVTSAELINYIDNPSAEASLSGWVDTGTSTVSSRTTDTNDLPRPSIRPAALKITMGGSGSDYTYYRFTRGQADVFRAFEISWFAKPGDTYSQTNLAVELWRNTQSDYLGTYTQTSLDTDIAGVTQVPKRSFFNSAFTEPNTGGQYYELRFVRTGGGVDPDNFYNFSDITIRPLQKIFRSSYNLVTAAKTLVCQHSYQTDTSGGAFAVSLPRPFQGDVIRINDTGKSWGTNNLTVNPDAGDTIDGDSTFICDVSETWVEFVATGNNTWVSRTALVNNIANFSGNVLIDGNLELSDSIDTTSSDLTIKSAGTAGILNTSAGAVKFPNIATTASGANAFLDIGDSNNILRSTSSIRYKKDVKDLIESDVEKLMKLKPITYRSKMTHDGSKRYLGFIAEEVAKIDPRIVNYMNGKPDGVQYDRLTVLLVEAIQKLTKKVEKLEDELSEVLTNG